MPSRGHDRIARFLAAHPEYSYEEIGQPGQGATNHVAFLRRHDELVVAKAFCTPERKAREAFALKHWRHTGLVPVLMAEEEPDLIVMSHLPGINLHIARTSDPDSVWHQACQDVGCAAAKFVSVPISITDQADFQRQFYNETSSTEAGTATLENYFDTILRFGHGVFELDADFQDPYWQRSLRFIAEQLPGILAERRALYHQDFGNLNVDRGRFIGFYDLEMCRVGCASMQLGSALGTILYNKGMWPEFRAGWQQAIRRPIAYDEIRRALAVYHALGWREITRYLSYNGTPGSGFSWASPADPLHYRNSFEQAEAVLCIRP
jgi:hypothetical protein